MVSYERSTARWTESMVLGSEVPDSSAPYIFFLGEKLLLSFLKYIYIIIYNYLI